MTGTRRRDAKQASKRLAGLDLPRSGAHHVHADERRRGLPPGRSFRLLLIGNVLLAASLAASALPVNGQPPAAEWRGRAAAVTFDDLPANGSLAAMRDTTTRLLRTLSAERIPATGFVNEYKLALIGQVEGAALLAEWLDSGHDLGNHTYSHVSIDEVPFETYKADLIRGEAVTRRLVEARGRRLRYFRHPQLRTGPTPEYKAALDGLLAERGYRVAPVTLDHNDFVFADVYRRARTRGDRDITARLAAAYVPYIESVFAHFERLSREFLGYELPQVLILHANELNADLLPDLVAMIRARGYAFVTLDTALQDPAYRLPEALHPRGLSWLHRWRLAKGLPVDPEPLEPPFVRELFNAPPR